MQIINRKITRTEPQTFEIKCFGFNSEKTLSIILENEAMINIRGKELYQLKKFLDGVTI